MLVTTGNALMHEPLFSRLQGYKQRNAYIATQGPLQNTVDDFWRMMLEHRCRCIVMLCELEEEDTVRETKLLYTRVAITNIHMCTLCVFIHCCVHSTVYSNRRAAVATGQKMRGRVWSMGH